MSLKHIEGVWKVVYQDDTVLAQFVDGKETPLNNINWSEIKTLEFKSEWSGVGLDITDPGEAYQRRLRVRTFMMPAVHLAIRVFLLVTYLADQEVSTESVKDIIYWAPNGATHRCKEFKCPIVAQWAQDSGYSGELKEIPDHAVA